METAADDAALALLADRRADGEPLQYLTGVAGFRHIELAVGPGVLVPRPETEEVAGRAIELLPDGGLLVDVGTGSGAIALAVADERPDAHVWATEISDEALEWARRNAAALESGIEIVKGDLFEGLPAEIGGAIDVVVSNPPYVAPQERDSLPTDVVDHEPAVALFAPEDGTSVISRLIAEAGDWLRPDGWIVIEIGSTQSDRVAGLLSAAGYEEVRVHPDLGGHPRVAVGRAPR
jgi:release factor glutamine methyltransferase